MDGDQHLWRAWTAAIHRWGLENWVATILESLGPLTILGAQFIYMAEPVFNNTLPEEHLTAAARLMEDTQRRQAFVRMLRENPSQ